jgi:spoIIIJ-associated protein
MHSTRPLEWLKPKARREGNWLFILSMKNLKNELNMPADKKDYYGKDVAEAIRNASEALHVSREKLDIEVVDTGSTGIFGLIRKKARIRATVKVSEAKKSESSKNEAKEPQSEMVKEPLQEVPASSRIETTAAPKDNELPSPAEIDSELLDDEGDDIEVAGEVIDEGEASPESLEMIRQELQCLVELMGFASAVSTSASGLSVECTVTGEFEAELIGPEGKTLDSLQYLIRKIVAKKSPERLRISVNIGDFRERRLEELKVLAVNLAAQVKADGKTQVIPALNPSERREIHIILQEDKEIRSRSVGDGLFKKILIYMPGKGTRSGKRKPSPRGKRTPSAKKPDRTE